MIVIGIDPGIQGAIAFLGGDEYGYLVIHDMPILKISRGTKTKSVIDIGRMTDIINLNVTQTHVFIEMAGARPENGGASSFTNGKNYGVLLGVIGYAGIPVTEVSPAKWKKSLQVPSDKDAARFRASQLLPRHATQWPLKKHDGRAEAALIALYGHRELNKK